MRLLGEIQRQDGIQKDGKAFRRLAVRAIIVQGRQLLMIYSPKNGDYKFPGGGIDPGETDHEALTREIREEAGAQICGEIREFGQVIEYGLPFEPGYDLFLMTSSYYLCQVHPQFGVQHLDDYEKDLAFRPTWVDIDEAIQTNLSVLQNDTLQNPLWTQRETFVLGLIKQELLNP
jgi:8-oxo-dGTP diphosphatase